MNTLTEPQTAGFKGGSRISCLILLFCSLFFPFSSIAQLAEIPFELEESGHIYLEVRLKGISRPLNFIFDICEYVSKLVTSQLFTLLRNFLHAVQH